MPHSWCTARRWQVRLPARLIVCQTSSSACFVWQLCLLLLVLTDKVSTAHEQPCTSPALSQGYCEFTDVEFDVGRHLIHVQSDASNATPCLGQGSGWTLLPRKTDNGVSSLDCCDQVFEEGHFFKFQRGTETSSFFERTLLPLFGVVRRLSASKCAEVALLPGIEQDAKIDWGAEEFLDITNTKIQMIQAVARRCSVLPLDRRLSAVNKTICFRRANFGIPSVNVSDPELVHGFLSQLRTALGVPIPSVRLGVKCRIGLTRMSAKQTLKILQKSELTKKLASSAEVIELTQGDLSLKEKVLQMQKMDVLVVTESDEAAVSNALFLPPWGVVVWLQSDGGSNADATELQKLLEARGPLLKHAVTPKVSANAVAPDDESMSELARVLYKAATMALQ